jgi:hypothetical protein
MKDKRNKGSMQEENAQGFQNYLQCSKSQNIAKEVDWL